mmetsp:Transcript_42682/g.132844  ORF Transcript_42682/g.132844 Transcript_42682/m.132844 type:complete len:132 (-) Transcript_42682:198-593(-)
MAPGQPRLHLDGTSGARRPSREAVTAGLAAVNAAEKGNLQRTTRLTTVMNARDSTACHTVQKREFLYERCWEILTWVRDRGLEEHPKWYPGLTKNASFHKIQERIFRDSPPFLPPYCPPPCNRTIAEHAAP